VVATHQCAEFEAKRELVKQDFEAEFPMIRTHSWSNVNRRVLQRVSPLFEGYVFVRECDRWWSIKSTRGVSHLLMTCERPAVLADDELQFFLSGAVDADGYYVDPVMRLFRVGQLATPRSGRFAGLNGKLTELDATGRCELLYSILGKELRVQTQVSALI